MAALNHNPARSALKGSARRGRRTPHGFSLIEVMIAFTILGVGLLAVAGAQVKSIQGSQSGRHLTQGAIVAQNQIERLARSRWTSLVPAGWTVPIATTTQVEDGNGGATEQTYTVAWRFLDLLANETRTIDVRVNWTEPDGRNRSLATSTIRFNRGNL
jgi:prepilin-type N-terminal cleavage/methylation domain-containing protein